MKNYYEILGIPENLTTEEISKIGRKKVQEESVDRIFSGKVLGKDYTEEEWRRANAKYAKIIEAYQFLKDERKRAEYDRKLNEARRRIREQEEARARQNFDARQRQYNPNGQTSQRQYNPNGQTSQRQYNPYGYTASGNKTNNYGTYSHQERAHASQNQANPRQSTQQNGNYSRTNNTAHRTTRRRIEQKSSFGKMVDSFKEVRKEEKAYPLYERHKNLNNRVRKGFHQNVRSVPGEIVYQLANGTIHITYEFIHQLKKLGYLTEDSVPKYIFRNRKLAAGALAIMLATIPNAGDDYQAFTPPDQVTVQTQDQTDPTIEDTLGIVYEEPTVKLNQYYEVVANDTLSRIATRTGVKVYEIQEMNDRIGTDKIYIGETLILPYTIDREDLQYYTITVPAKGISVKELAKKYRTDAETIMQLNKEAVAYVNDGYIVLTDTAVVPQFITVDELDTIKSAAEDYNY